MPTLRVASLQGASGGALVLQHSIAHFPDTPLHRNPCRDYTIKSAFPAQNPVLRH